MILSVLDDKVAHLRIGLGFKEADVAPALRREIPHVFTQARVGDFSGDHLPSYDEDQRCSGDGEKDFDTSHDYGQLRNRGTAKLLWPNAVP